MVTYADSSFLVSVYIADANSPTANKFLAADIHLLCLTSFSKSETQHAMRMVAFRGGAPHDVMTRGLLTFEQDQQDGLYDFVSLGNEDLFKKASQLSNRHALGLGVRYLDTLHVASALLVNAKNFLTFDLRQRKLAKAAGLNVRL